MASNNKAIQDSPDTCNNFCCMKQLLVTDLNVIPFHHIINFPAFHFFSWMNWCNVNQMQCPNMLSATCLYMEKISSKLQERTYMEMIYNVCIYIYYKLLKWLNMETRFQICESLVNFDQIRFEYVTGQLTQKVSCLKL